MSKLTEVFQHGFPLGLWEAGRAATECTACTMSVVFIGEVYPGLLLYWGKAWHDSCLDRDLVSPLTQRSSKTYLHCLEEVRSWQFSLHSISSGASAYTFWNAFLLTETSRSSLQEEWRQWWRWWCRRRLRTRQLCLWESYLAFPFSRSQICAAFCIRRGNELVQSLVSLCLLFPTRLAARQYVSRVYCTLLESP